jgi:NAD-dependent protein deacetylase/lipoamidase
MESNQVLKAKEALATAKRVAVITGAGISAESGVPTFRGKEGFWKTFNPTDLATEEAFRRDPKMVWEWYNWRREVLCDCKPNAGHRWLVELEKKKGDGFLLITQNVDGLHQLAGSRRIAEMHGCIWRVRHLDGGGDAWENRTVPLSPLPLQDKEGRLLRPDVVWYGESLPVGELRKVNHFFSGGVDLLLVIGTSAQIGYIQSFVGMLYHKGTTIVEVNEEETIISEMADCCLKGKSGDLLQKL